MKMDGITLVEGSQINNLVVASGTAFPSNPDDGEMFYRSDASATVKGLYLYVNGSWDRIASSDTLTVPNGASLPGSANEGDLYYLNSNDSSEGLYVYKDTAWLNVSTSSLNVLKSGDTMTGALGIVAGNEGAPGLFFSGDTDTGIFRATTDTLAFTTNASVRLRIDGNGAWGLGGANYGTSGQVLTSNGSGSAPTWQSASGGGATISNDTSTNASYYPVWVTTTSGSATNIYTTDSKLYFNPSTGTLNATVFNSLSDYNKKHDITSISNGLSTVEAMNGVEFRWNDTDKKSSGVIAQELEHVLPFLVETNEHGEKSVNYNGIIGYLIEAVKELSAKVKELESK